MTTTSLKIENSLHNKCKIWFKVDNFADILQTNWTKKKTIESQEFRILSDKWTISIKCLNDDIGLYLNLIQTYESCISVQYDMYIVDNDNQIYGKRSYNRTFEKIEGFGSKVFIKTKQLMDKKDRLLPDNKLTVVVDMTVHKNNNNIVFNSSLKFDHLFGIRELSDCRLVVGKNKSVFFVSKLILSARSDVFLKMFTTDCLEKTTNKVIIKDIDSIVFGKFLRYLYTGKCNDLNKWYPKLLIVADRYLVASLKTICLNQYYMKINGENAIKTLKLLQDFGADEDLMAKTHEFVAKNVASVLGKLITKDYDIRSQSVTQIGYKIENLIKNNDKK
ncbi:speckle-type POZ protein-like [Oppia nitens]|uniref:speckle-type POZ protein-like n=1 Tax=Oppia nitens TaxID=1686743 RepID=UPI0023DCB930|nr:speckle-type POZ protein-like [Oppia nitens]